ncbi:hypothetical protein INT43_002993 [Umbelopsis isabellina]|uniref:PPM-type phosphatase domain-containing protein n=1 Tax=Mortierella isabellina TaxID=91625 RepID=A0A8H7PPK5_MORIS|nr:hypothetical protein INT43_002993 [Umbelopsis isabellina]
MFLNRGRLTATRSQRALLHSQAKKKATSAANVSLLPLLGTAGAITVAATLYHSRPALNEAVKTEDGLPIKKVRLFQTAIDRYDNRPFEILPQKSIDGIFRSGEVAYKFAQPIKYVSGVYVNSLRSNDPIEDHYSVDTIGSDKLIAGVYDGHIGPECSKLIRHKIPIYVAQHIEHLPLTKSVDKVMGAISSAFEELDNHIQQRFLDLFPKNLSKLSAKDIRGAIANRKDQKETRKIIEEAIHGSCASIAYVDGKDVYTANTGDSRSVVVSVDKDGNWIGKRLVEEQTPARPAWRELMESQHPASETPGLIRKNRVFGLIAVGGAFGDIMYKVPVEHQTAVLPNIPADIYQRFARYHHRIIANYRTPPYLYSKPIVTHYEMQENDRFIVIATDGLWWFTGKEDEHSADGDQAVADIMSKWKGTGEAEEVNPATHLMKKSFVQRRIYDFASENSKGNFDEAVEVSKLLTKQPSRHFRDDITIIVIQLHVNQNSEKKDPSLYGEVIEARQVDVKSPKIYTKAQTSWASWFSG